MADSDNPFMKFVPSYDEKGSKDEENPFMKFVPGYGSKKSEKPINDEYDERSLQSLQESFSGVTPKGMDKQEPPEEWRKSGGTMYQEALGMGGMVAGSAVGGKIGAGIGTAIMPGAGSVVGGVVGAGIGGGVGYYAAKGANSPS